MQKLPLCLKCFPRQHGDVILKRGIRLNSSFVDEVNDGYDRQTFHTEFCGPECSANPFLMFYHGINNTDCETPRCQRRDAALMCTCASSSERVTDEDDVFCDDVF